MARPDELMSGFGDLLEAEISARLGGAIIQTKRACLANRMLFVPQNFLPVVRTEVIAAFGTDAERVLEKIWNARTQELFEAAVQVTVALAASRAVLQVRENRSDLRDVLRAEMLAGISAMLGSLGAADHWQENAADWANALAETILHDMTVKPEPPACCD